MNARCCGTLCAVRWLTDYDGAVLDARQYMEDETLLETREDLVQELKCHDEPDTCLLETVRSAALVRVFVPRPCSKLVT